MQNSEIANFYERDIRRLIEEINLFKNEENLWNAWFYPGGNHPQWRNPKDIINPDQW
jgi:hypothetical protein